MKPPQTSATGPRAGWLAVLAVTTALRLDPAGGQDQFPQAVGQLADDLADVILPSGALVVRPAFGGMPGLGGGAAAGFMDLFRDPLVARGLAPDPDARLTFVVRLEPVLDDRPPRAYLVGTLTGPGQPKEGRIIRGRWMIDDAAELAQWAGLSADLPRRRREAQGAGFRGAIDRGKIFVSPDRRRLHDSKTGRFGLAVGVGGVELRNGRLQGAGRPLLIEERVADGVPAVAFIQVRRGDAFYVELTNDEPYEVAVSLMIDGLNSFHYSTARKPDGSAYRYHVVPPRSSIVVGGWERGDGEIDSRFEVASAAESQAAREGIAVESIGLITATVHACWEIGRPPPADEPEPPRMAFATARFLSPRDESGKQSVGTRFGDTFDQGFRGVERLIGVPRAVLALRYEEAP